jgi:hypothetical protein
MPSVQQKHVLSVEQLIRTFIPVYDSRVNPPIRKCDECLNEELDAKEYEDEDSYDDRMNRKDEKDEI